MNRVLRKPIVVTALAVFCTILWGSAFPSVKSGYELFQIQNGTTADKLVFAGMRFLAAGVVILLLLLILPGKGLKIKKKDCKGILVLGLLQTFIQYFFFYIALSNLSGSKGSILNATGTFFVVILSHFLLKNEKLNMNKIVGCLVGFAGIVLINLTGDTDLHFSVTGEGFMVLAALSFALGSVYSKMIVKNMDPLLLTGYQLSFGGVLLLLVGFLQGGRLGTLTPEGLLIFAYLVFISAAGFGIWTLLIKYNEVTKISIFNCLTPVFGTVLSGIFLSEEILKLKNFIALLLVVAGIYLVNTYGTGSKNYYKAKGNDR